MTKCVTGITVLPRRRLQRSIRVASRTTATSSTRLRSAHVVLGITRDVFPPAGAGVVGPDNGGVMPDSAAHRRGRSDGRNPVARPDDRCRESCYRSRATPGAGPAVLAAHYGGGNGRCDVRRQRPVPAVGGHRCWRRRDVSRPRPWWWQCGGRDSTAAAADREAHRDQRACRVARAACSPASLGNFGA